MQAIVMMTKNPYISFLGYSGRLVPKTEKRGGCLACDGEETNIQKCQYLAAFPRKGKDHLFPKKKKQFMFERVVSQKEQVKNISE